MLQQINTDVQFSHYQHESLIVSVEGPYILVLLLSRLLARICEKIYVPYKLNVLMAD